MVWRLPELGNSEINQKPCLYTSVSGKRSSPPPMCVGCGWENTTVLLSQGLPSHLSARLFRACLLASLICTGGHQIEQQQAWWPR